MSASQSPAYSDLPEQEQRQQPQTPLRRHPRPPQQRFLAAAIETRAGSTQVVATPSTGPEQSHHGRPNDARPRLSRRQRCRALRPLESSSPEMSDDCQDDDALLLPPACVAARGGHPAGTAADGSNTTPFATWKEPSATATTTPTAIAAATDNAAVHPPPASPTGTDVDGYDGSSTNDAASLCLPPAAQGRCGRTTAVVSTRFAATMMAAVTAAASADDDHVDRRDDGDLRAPRGEIISRMRSSVISSSSSSSSSSCTASGSSGILPLDTEAACRQTNASTYGSEADVTRSIECWLAELRSTSSSAPPPLSPPLRMRP